MPNQNQPAPSSSSARLLALESALRSFLALEPDYRGTAYISVRAEEACLSARAEARAALDLAEETEPTETVLALESALRSFLALEPDYHGRAYFSVRAEEACLSARTEGRAALARTEEASVPRILSAREEALLLFAEATLRILTEGGVRPEGERLREIRRTSSAYRLEPVLSDAPTGRSVSAYEIEDHGVHGSGSFQGAGIALSSWEGIGTGIGSSPGEALADALEMLAQAGWSVSDEIEEDALQEIGPEYAERETVSEEIEEALPPLSWTVSSSSWSGLASVSRFRTFAEARSSIAHRLREARSRGLSVLVPEYTDGISWEIHEPEDAGSISDLAGWIQLSSNEEELERERAEIHERAEPVHVLSVRVR